MTVGTRIPFVKVLRGRWPLQGFGGKPDDAYRRARPLIGAASGQPAE